MHTHIWCIIPSGEERRCVYIHTARAGRGQVGLRETRGAVAAHSHGGDHSHQCHLHAGRPQRWEPGQRWRCRKTSQCLYGWFWWVRGSYTACYALCVSPEHIYTIAINLYKLHQRHKAVTDCITKVYMNIQLGAWEISCVVVGTVLELKDCPSVRRWQTRISLRKVSQTNDVPTHKFHREFFAVGFQCH